MLQNTEHPGYRMIFMTSGGPSRRGVGGEWLTKKERILVVQANRECGSLSLLFREIRGGILRPNSGFVFYRCF